MDVESANENIHPDTRGLIFHWILVFRYQSIVDGMRKVIHKSQKEEERKMTDMRRQNRELQRQLQDALAREKQLLKTSAEGAAGKLGVSSGGTPIKGETGDAGQPLLSVIN